MNQLSEVYPYIQITLVICAVAALGCLWVLIWNWQQESEEKKERTEDGGQKTENRPSRERISPTDRNE